MRTSFSVSIALIAAGCILPASATVLHVEESGTFGSATTTTAYSVSNGSFTFSYNVDSNPVITGFSTGAYFETTISNFSYMLNGVSIAAENPGSMFFALGQGGLLSVCFSYPCAPSNVFVLQGPQVFSGLETAPTILEGIYTPTSVRFGEDFLASAGDVTISEAVDLAPEPSALVLLGTGILAAAGVKKRRAA